MFTVSMGWYHMVPKPFRSPFIVTEVVLASKCSTRCHFASHTLYCILELQNKLTGDWLSSRIKLDEMPAFSCRLHRTSFCVKKTLSYSLSALHFLSCLGQFLYLWKHHVGYCQILHSSHQALEGSHFAHLLQPRFCYTTHHHLLHSDMVPY